MATRKTRLDFENIILISTDVVFTALEIFTRCTVATFLIEPVRIFLLRHDTTTSNQPVSTEYIIYQYINFKNIQHFAETLILEIIYNAGKKRIYKTP